MFGCFEACFFSFRGSKAATSPRCEGRFSAWFEPGFRWCLAVLSASPRGCRGLSGLGCVTFSVYGLGLVSSPLGVPKVPLRHAAKDGFLLGLRPDLGGVWLF